MSLKDLVADIYPLSPMQEGMLFHVLMAPEAGLYFIQTRFTLAGALEEGAFREAWRRAVERLAILRTGFLWENLEQPVQVVHRRAEPPFSAEDWRELGAGEQERRLTTFQVADRARGFDPALPPLFRLALFRLADERFELLFSYHHLLLDAWSGPDLLAEVFAEYGALAAGRTFSPPPRRPYRDYIAWLQAQDPARSEAFWRARLAGFREPTPLPADRPAVNAELPPESYRRWQLRLTPALSSALLATAKAAQVTVSTLVQSAWAMLLGRAAGTRDVVAGVVVAGRPPSLPGAEAIIGLFINTLPLRARFEEGATLAELWSALHAAQGEASAHEHTPLAAIQGWSEVPRDRALFDSLVVFGNTPAGSGLIAADSPLRVERVETLERTNYPLTLEIRPDEELLLLLDVQLPRFDATTAERLLRRLGTLLSGMVGGGARSPEALPQLAAAERHQLEREWNDTARAFPGGGTLGERLAASLAAGPEGVALVFDSEHLSAGALAARSAALALRLAAAGCGPGSFVGVAVQRSLELPLALLAILRAGAAYVPLDPDLPARRLADMLADARPGLVLAGAGQCALLPAGVPLLELAAAAFAPGEGALPGGAGLDDPAYAIFTSGSTGRPKAAINTHRGIVNRLLWMQERYGLGRGDRVLQKTPMSFDVSVWELFWPLLAGATEVIAVPGGHRDPGYLLELIAAERVTVAHFVPSMLAAFAEEEGLARAACLRLLVASGEALPAELAGRVVSALPAALENLYGPTEAAVDVTSWPAAGLRGSTVPIGRPVANTAVIVVDRAGRPQPLGVPGELWLTGVQVGMGYLDRPRQTAERFVPDPISGLPGARAYRTGDLARTLPGGEVEYLGRIDFQVKLAGQRIELGEIEAVLLGHPAVAQAVVALAATAAGGPMLAAYLVPRGVAPSAAELAEHLRASLPEAMVPRAFVVLAALPRTPSGKLDRRALPAPAATLGGPSPGFVAPQSELERQIAEAWRWALGADRVSAEDNFFDLGGNSLALVKAVGRLRKTLGRPLSVAEAFRYPSVRRLAAHLGQAEAGPTAAERRAEMTAELERGRSRLLERRGRQPVPRREEAP